MKRCKNHLLFADDYEYFHHEGEVFRAPDDACIDADTGYRKGGRFECRLDQWNQYSYPYPGFAPNDFICLSKLIENEHTFKIQKFGHDHFEITYRTPKCDSATKLEIEGSIYRLNPRRGPKVRGRIGTKGKKKFIEWLDDVVPFRGAAAQKKILNKKVVWVLL